MADVVTLSGLTRFFPLINAGFLCGLIGMVIKYRLENRKLSIHENTGLRAEFINEMKELRDEVRGLRQENNQLREEVHQLHNVIDGLRRQSMGESISAQRVLMEALPPGSVSPELQAAAVRSDEARNERRRAPLD